MESLRAVRKQRGEALSEIQLAVVDLGQQRDEFGRRVALGRNVASGFREQFVIRERGGRN